MYILLVNCDKDRKQDKNRAERASANDERGFLHEDFALAGTCVKMGSPCPPLWHNSCQKGSSSRLWRRCCRVRSRLCTPSSLGRWKGSMGARIFRRLR